MALPATEDFTGTAGNLSASWTQQRTTRRLQRNGSGVGIQDATDASDVNAFWNADTFANDQYSQLVLVDRGDGAFGVTVRAANTGDSAWDAYEFYTDTISGGGHTELAVIVNGASTVLRSYATTVAAGNTIKLDVVGTTLTAYKNGVSLGTQSDSTYSSGSAGINSWSGNTTRPTFDNWEGGNIGGAVVATAPRLAWAMRPTAQRVIGRAALAMRAVLPIQAPATGAVFADAVAESVPVADTETATADFAVSRAEALTAADTETATADFSVARAESLAVAETATGTLVAAVARAETLAATDSSTGALVASTAVAEAIAATDAQTGALVAAVARAESLSVADSQDATVVSAGASTRAEVLTVADTQTATVVYAVSVVEALSVADLQTLLEDVDVGRGVLMATAGGRYALNASRNVAGLVADPAGRYPLTKKGPP